MDYPSVNHIEISSEFIVKWQKIVNIAADLLNVPAALIMKVDPPYIEVFSSSNSQGNPYHVGDREHLAGLYCETVIKNDDKLLIPNALNDDKWKDNPDIDIGMISYLGFPLKWPDGTFFGTICVLDSKENRFSKNQERLIRQFKELIESHLDTIYKSKKLAKQLEYEKNLEKDLKTINSRFSTIFDNIEQGICLHEMIYEDNKAVDYRIIEANPAYEMITGIPLDKSKGILAKELYATEKAPYIDIYEEVARTGKTVTFEDYYEPMDKYFHITVSCPGKGRFITLFYDITERKRMEERIRENEKKLSITLHSIGDGVITTDIEGRIVMLNPTTEELTGWSSEKAKGKKLLEVFNIINARTGETAEDPVQRVLESGQLVGLANDTTLISKDGSKYQIADSASPIKDNEGNILGVVLVFRDITEKYNLMEEIRETKKTLSVLLANLPGMAYKCRNDKDWTMEFVSKGCKELTGYDPQELLYNKEVSYGNLITPDCKQYVWEKVQNSLKDNDSFEVEYKIGTKSKEEKWVWEQGQGVFDESGKLENIHGFITEITERKKREERIQYISLHDSLTGLYNRTFLEEEIERLNVARQLPMSLVMADLNGLKLINDTYGHSKGDEVLIKTGKILKELFRKEDIIARYGGDEFVILLPETNEEEVQKMLKRIKKHSTEILVGKKEEDKIPISISLGYAVKCNASEDVYKKLKIAEDRMYKDKLLESKSTKSHIVKSLLKTLQEKSQETEEHGRRMSKLALALGEKIGLSHAEQDRLSLLASLHDIGKTIIFEKVLKKPDKLTNEEWEEIIKHPGTGYRICSETEEFSHIALDILSHHERWDGNGYPQGLNGEEIPLLARIISIVDAYDVMTNGRPYKKAMTKNEALEELARCSGSQFDPGLLELFKEAVRKTK